MVATAKKTYIAKAMKRLNNLYDRLLSIDTILEADQIARRNKSRQKGIIDFDKNFDQNIADLYKELVNKTYKTSAYRVFKIYEPKEREISMLPYRDRIVQHAIMLIIEPMMVSTFTADTYSCIKGKGIHAADRAVKKALCDVKGTKYCLKMDIKKFYPSVDREILKGMLRRKIKDVEMLELLDGIIDSAPGLPIGNLLSQYFANFYLMPFDHWIKEKKKVKYYFRYADDIVILSDSKEYLHRVRVGITKYFYERLNLQVKGNYQVFPVASRGIDFVGYVKYHRYSRLRKSIKKSFARKVSKGINDLSKASYLGWAKHCDSRNLIRKLLPNEPRHNVTATKNKVLQRL